MRQAWELYLNLLPLHLRKPVDELYTHQVLETRLRLNQKPEIVTQNGCFWLDKPISQEDLKFTVNVASRYSPWSAETISQGYITAAGGNRIGICGQAALCSSKVHTIRAITSLCIRAAHDIYGIAPEITKDNGSILIIGCPGSGKTTLLRDLIRHLSRRFNVSVVDEREEIFPVSTDGFCFSTGKRTDVLSGCPKAHGIDMVLRTMTPDYIAVDEITADSDCEALLRAGWCGVKLLATAHARDMDELLKRPVYRPIVECRLFDTFFIMRQDKTYYMERMQICC